MENCEAILRAKIKLQQPRNCKLLQLKRLGLRLKKLTYYSEHKVRSLDLWLPFHQGKGNRGLGAYEPRRGSAVANIYFSNNKSIYLPLFAAVASNFVGQSKQTLSLTLRWLSHKPNSQIQQTRAWPTWNGVRINTMPLPPLLPYLLLNFTCHWVSCSYYQSLR